MNGNNEFDDIINQQFTHNTPPPHLDPTPYGIPEHPHKPGLTARGKVALGIGSAFLAGSTLIGWQAYSAEQAENEAKAQEIAFKAEALELAKLKEINRAAEAGRKTQSSAGKAFQADVDTCVKDREDQIGKGLSGPSLRDVVDACRAQYQHPTGTPGMEEAGSAHAAEDAGGGLNQGVLIGGGALAAALLVAARRGKRSDAA